MTAKQAKKVKVGAVVYWQGSPTDTGRVHSIDIGRRDTVILTVFWDDGKVSQSLSQVFLSPKRGAK